jgi:acyl phosphate:glycerol-3-phosphate acyltransferase
MGALPVEAFVAVLALVGGHLAGSIPVDRLLARGAGVDLPPDEERRHPPVNLGALAGQGWGVLGLTGDLALGVLPVAIASVSWSWEAGWIAGVGALLGACWPMLGRWTGGSGLVVLAGALFALEPPAGVVAALCALAAAGIARLVGRRGREAAIAAGLVAYPLVFAAAEADVRRLLAILVLYGIAAIRVATTRRPPRPLPGR